MENKIPLRFFIITFLWTWVIFIPSVLIGLGFFSAYKEIMTKLTDPILVLACFGPSVGAIITIYTLYGKKRLLEFFKSFISLKFGRKVWVLIFLIVAIPNIISLIITILLGYVPSQINYYNILLFPLYWIVKVFLGGGQEEIGWRCYILKPLEKKYGYIFGSLILGIIWAIWHIPFWFIPGTAQNMLNMNFIGFMLSCIGWSYVFSWIMDLSKNKLLAGLIVHGTLNAYHVLFSSIKIETGDNLILSWLGTILVVLTGTIIVIMRQCKNKTIQTS
jgi:membrane protease YdiL (CAAX protease family)